MTLVYLILCCQKFLCESDRFSICFFLRNGSGSTSSMFVFLFSTSQLFPNCFCSHIFCICFEFFTFTNNFPNLWSSNFKQICPNSFRSWDYIFFKKGDCSSPKILCKNSKTFFRLSCMSSKNREIS